MKNSTRLKLALLLTSVFAGVCSMVLALIIYFQNWNMVMSDAERWQLNKFPVALWAISLVLYFLAKLVPKS